MADVLAEGISTIRVSAQWAALAGVIVALLFEFLRIIPFFTCLAMFRGCVHLLGADEALPARTAG